MFASPAGNPPHAGKLAQEALKSYDRAKVYRRSGCTKEGCRSPAGAPSS